MRARWPRQLFGLGRGIDVTTTLSDGLDGAADATVCHVITTRQCGDSRLVGSHCGKPLPRTPSPATTTTYPHPCSRSQRYKDDKERRLCGEIARRLKYLRGSFGSETRGCRFTTIAVAPVGGAAACCSRPSPPPRAPSRPASTAAP